MGGASGGREEAQHYPGLLGKASCSGRLLSRHCGGGRNPVETRLGKAPTSQRQREQSVRKALGLKGACQEGCALPLNPSCSSPLSLHTEMFWVFWVPFLCKSLRHSYLTGHVTKGFALINTDLAWKLRNKILFMLLNMF